MAMRHHRSVPILLSGLLSGGCACLALVVLTHVAERLGILPGMGWGRPDSPGHYIDLSSAILGIGLTVAAGLMRFVVGIPGGE
jgi:hypothetical protein